jgi:hypothetical protein
MVANVGTGNAGFESCSPRSKSALKGCRLRPRRTRVDVRYLPSTTACGMLRRCVFQVHNLHDLSHGLVTMCMVSHTPAMAGHTLIWPQTNMMCHIFLACSSYTVAFARTLNVCKALSAYVHYVNARGEQEVFAEGYCRIRLYRNRNLVLGRTTVGRACIQLPESGTLMLVLLDDHPFKLRAMQSQERRGLLHST